VLECQETKVCILQPGSTVATSLIEAEAKQKHAFLLNVGKNGFEVKPIPLKRVRPFLHRSLELNNATCPPIQNLVEVYLKKQIETLLE
jgi:double-strand break repair protein MRE11